MHPLKSAIEKLHTEAEKLHEATQDFQFTTEEKDKLIDILLGYLPAAMDAAQDMIAAAFAYFTTRG